MDPLSYGPVKRPLVDPISLPSMATWGLAVVLACAVVVAATRCGSGAVLIAADSFDSDLRNGWGSTDAGGSYSLVGDPSDFDVSGGVGTILLRYPATPRAAYLAEVSIRDLGAALRVTTDRAPAGGRHFIYLCLRRTDQAEYMAKLSLAEGGAVFVQATSLSRAEAGVEREIALSPEFRLDRVVYEPGMWINLEAQISGGVATNLRIRAWLEGGPRPGWQVSISDALPERQLPGTVGIRARVGQGVADLPVLVRLDDLRVGQ